MKKVRWACALLLVGFLATTTQAEVIMPGFQGVFGNGDVSPLTFFEGATSGTTVDLGLTASIDDLVIDLSGYELNGDAVSISNLVLRDTNGGSATYIWDIASLYQVMIDPGNHSGAGIIAGSLTLSANDLTTVMGENVSLPNLVLATLTYNGIIVTSDNSSGTANVVSYPSASISVMQAPVITPEPSTIVFILTGLVAFVFWRRKK